MTNVHPNALSLAVAVAISSSLVAAQTLTDRRLQIKSVDIRGNEPVEFTQSEILVQPTIGHDQQPILKSFTTIYPYQPQESEDYVHPSSSLTAVLSGIDGGVYSVDQFETDENNVAQKYTKVLEVGDEGVFRFTHNLEENELVIEVRGGMTDQDSVKAVRDQLGGLGSLEPLTKIASPIQLAFLLEGADNRAGSLGTSDHYVALATVNVEKVEVNGRTFMRLIASGDTPPELHSLGQSLFVNDDVLLTAAASAYIQVHVLGEDLQQQALNELLAHNKPVGYVVHVEDDKQSYPVPENYPKLEVTEATRETIVFRGQKQNPADVAFVKALSDIWKRELKNNAPPPGATAKVKKDKVESYRYIIRSRQMDLLEELAEEHSAGLNKAGQTTFKYDGKLSILAYYEYLQQVLTCATLDGADEFELTVPHVKIASSFITPTWIHLQLMEYFGFKPVLRNFLTSRHFVQTIHEVIPIMTKMFSDTPGKDESFISKVVADFTGKLLERESLQEKLQQKEAKLSGISRSSDRATAAAIAKNKQTLTVKRTKQQIRDKLMQPRRNLDDSPPPAKQARLTSIRTHGTNPAVATTEKPEEAAAIKARYATIASYLNIEDFDSNDDINTQEKHLLQKIKALRDQKKQLIHEQESFFKKPQTVDVELNTENAYTRAKKGALAAVLGIEPDDGSIPEDDVLEKMVYTRLFSLAELEEELADIKTPGHPKIRPEVIKTLNAVNKALRMREINQKEDLHLQRRYISETMQAFIRDAREHAEFVAQRILEDVEEELSINLNEEDNKTTRLTRIFKILNNADLSDNTLAQILDEVDSILWAYESRALDWDDLIRIKLHAYLHHKFEDSDPDNPTGKQQIDLLKEVEAILRIPWEEEKDLADRLAWVREVLDKDLTSEDTMDQIDETLWQKDSEALNERQLELKKLGAILTYKTKDSCLDKQAREQQASMLDAIENKLSINPHENLAAKERGKAFAAKLASDLKIAFAEDDKLPAQKDALRGKIQALMDELHEACDDEGVRRARNNEVAHQLNIDDYKEDATIDDQNSLIETKLQQLDEDVFNAGQPSVNERIADIDNELHRQMARLGPKPRFVLDRELATAREELKEAEIGLMGLYHKLNMLRGKRLVFAGNRADLQHISDDDNRVLNQAIKGLDESDIPEEALGELPLARKNYNQVTEFLREHDRKSINAANEKQDPEHEALLEAAEEAMGLTPDSTDTFQDRVDALRSRQVKLGGNDGTGGKIRQLIQERDHLEADIKTRRADIKTMKKVLEAAETAVENDGGPFQYTPEQAIFLAAIDAFTQHNALRHKALEAALGLAELAVKSGNEIPWLKTFDFDNELAPIHLRILVGDNLPFNQASDIVEVFKSLKKSFPPPPDQPVNIVEQIHTLVCGIRNQLGKGAQQYDAEIHSMGQRAIHNVEHTGDLKDFSEYLAAHSASGNKIITLLREGLISKIELENYVKAVRSIDIKAGGFEDFHRVAEFEFFLFYRHRVNLPLFNSIVHTLSDKGAEEFMQSVFTPVTLTKTGPVGMKESVDGMKEYAAAVIANYVLDDIAFDNGRRTAAFLTNVQATLTPYANAAGLSETELIKAIHGTLKQAHGAAVEYQLNKYWGKPSAFLVQAVTWYYSSYKPLLVTHTTVQAAEQSLLHMSFLYLLDLTNRGDYLHRMLIPFEHWLERFGVDPDRTGQYAYHHGIEQLSEVGGLAMPLGKAASSVILLRTGAMLFARQHNANPQMYRSISRLLPETVKSMSSGQGIQVPLLHRVTPQKVKTLASATAGLVLGPVATVGAYAHGLISGFTYAQTFGFALASSLTFDFFMNDNKMLTQWLGGPLGRSLDRINHWLGVGETGDEYMKRSAIASPQRFNENDEAYANRVKANNTMYGWTRHENYLQFRERRDRTMKLFENGWEKYFRENVPKWSFSHAESIPYSYTLGAFYELRRGDDQKVHGHDKGNALQSGSLSATMTH
ncbi:hypothetical protein [Endozoicomonas sp. 8E]|uniref:hypothetical protein n=1 Tax=Endozoicomonas sp. 8E TaxID=3035692 RepID=UPI002938FB80|nr:hypothetical protein [Endozoicomonas sp. 8E]WOG29619.1 hypothetical protein P6910_08185 [Endozoicomonas sp. 8E]